MAKTFNEIVDEYDRRDVLSPSFADRLRFAHYEGLLPGIQAKAGLPQSPRADQSGLFPKLHRGLDRLQLVFERARQRLFP